MQHKAHVIGAKQRTDDIRTTEEVSFSALLLSDVVLDGLKSAGFLQPSPIQLKAIPLGKCGLDLVVQAKSGTGKTCVLAVVALEQLLAGSAIHGQRCQTLVLAPTREVAVQIASVVTAVGAEIKDLVVQMFIGGTPLTEDIAHCKRCHVAVGTPGRVKHLIESGHLKTDSVRLFVMDEADKLMDSSFVDDINYIYTTLPTTKQMLALSATYPESLAALLARYMRSPTFVRLSKSNQSLLGIGQYVMSVDQHGLPQRQIQLKMMALRQLLSNIDFTQCLVFSNYQTRAETISGELERAGWPTAHISAALSQQQRLAAVARLTALQCRVLVSTDLAARGLDCQHVDLIVHLEVARDAATFLHRAGRAGRYGSLGAAVTLAARGPEAEQLVRVARAAGVTLRALPEQLPSRLQLKLEDPLNYQLFSGGGDDNAELVVDGCDSTPQQSSVDLSRPDAPSERAVLTPVASAGDGGRRVLKARRRATPSADVKSNGRDGERMEAAMDGWFSAVNGARRNNRPPCTPDEATLFPQTSQVSLKTYQVSPKTSQVSPKTSTVSPKTFLLAGDGDTDGVGRTVACQDRADSPDSDDSFATALRAYRLEQESRLQDDQNCSVESSGCLQMSVESDQSAATANSACSPSAIDWSLVQSAIGKLHPAVKDAAAISAEELSAVEGYLKCVLSGGHVAMYNKLIGQVDEFGASKVFRSIFQNESDRLDLAFLKSILTEGMLKLSVGGSDVDVAQGNTGRGQRKVTVPDERSLLVAESSEVRVNRSADEKNDRQVVADPDDDEVQRLETNEDDLLTFQVDLRRRVALREQELLLARTAGPVAADHQDDSSSSSSSDSDGQTRSAGRSRVQSTYAAPADATGHVHRRTGQPQTSSVYQNHSGYAPVIPQTSSGYGNHPVYPSVHPETSGYGNYPGYPSVHPETSSGYGYPGYPSVHSQTSSGYGYLGYPSVHSQTYTGYPPTLFSHEWFQHPVDHNMYPGYYPLHQHPPGRQWRLQQQLLQCYHEQTSYLSHMTAFCYK